MSHTRMYEVQQKVYSRLVEDNDFMKSVNGLFDYVPEKTKTPYVTFDTLTSTPNSTKTSDGETVTVTLDIWSESKGRKEVIEILKLIELSLSADVELDTAFLMSQEITRREVWEENYGLYQGTVDIEFQIDWEE